MKQNLLAIVKDVLTIMDSEDVNSIDDTVEAQQVADVVRIVYNNIVAARVIPEHQELIQLTSLSSSTYPTHFLYGDSVKEFTNVSYDNSETAGETDWREVTFCEPMEFLTRTDNQKSNYVLVPDKSAGTNLSIGNNAHPTFYTSFDDEHIVMNSYKSTVDTVLRTSKSRAWGTKYPAWSNTDTFVPDLDDTLFPYLFMETVTMCASVFKGENSPKLEQAARRLKSYIQNDQYRTKRETRPNGYGR